MKYPIREFVISAVESRKDRSFVRESLLGKVSDIEVRNALNLFDSLQENSSKKPSFVNFLGFAFHPIKLFFLLILFWITKFIVGLRKILGDLDKDYDVKSISLFSENKSLSKDFLQKFNSKNRLGKFVFVSFIFILGILLIWFIFASFIYSKPCDSSACFKTMISVCHRADFISSDLVRLDNQIVGLTSGGCEVEVRAVDNNLGISMGEKMTCYIPLGLSVLPQSKLDLCSGKLRESIQEIIISELYKTIGQNVEELNSFFKVSKV